MAADGRPCVSRNDPAVADEGQVSMDNQRVRLVVLIEREVLDQEEDSVKRTS
ncbi:hypothetical protein [Falsiroseomonas tokyonensis]|uniref:hypothetical protein n=1 Tax=Falsiroseomonas tokyonensis TaxID=430521 RepID=UPI001C20BF04|nr:hypothetical protein [Falsiroseomonas tokyonensis]